jgi:predicted phosphate transport protein (TIGR00153 family)
MRLRIIPTEGRFFDMFNQGAETVLEGATALLDLLEHFSDVDRKARRLKDIEHQGDEINHQIFDALNRTFVTPLDREDISYLAGALDDVVDWTEEVARRIRIYKIDEPTDLARMFAKVLVDQAHEIRRAVGLLEDLKGRDAIHKAVIEIHRLENEADELAMEALSGLYEGVADVPALVQRIKWGDLYAVLEEATDKADQVAHALHNIAIKHA